MKILKFNEYLFELSGILVLKRDPLSLVRAFFTNFLFVFVMGPCACGGTAVFIYYNHDQFGPYMSAVLCFSGAYLVLGKYLAMKLSENNIKKLIELFQKTVDEAPADVRRSYHHTESRGHRLSKTFCKVTTVATVTVANVVPISFAIYNIIIGRLDTRQWFHGIYMVLPYEKDTIPHYFLRATVEIIIAVELSIVLVSSVTFFINCHHLLEVGFADFESRWTGTDKFTKKNLVCAIKLQNRLRDLAELLKTIMSVQLFIYLVSMVGFSASALNLLDFKEYGFLAIEGLLAILVGMLWCFVYCFLATRISTKIEQMSDIVYQSPWHNFPIDMQNAVILMIRRSQVPLQFDCLEMFDCNMETYAKILRLISSYYLMLREIRAN